MSSMLLRIATVAVAGLVVFSAVEAEARGNGGGGRSGPSVSSGLSRGVSTVSPGLARGGLSSAVLRQRPGWSPIGRPTIRPIFGRPIIARPIPIIRPIRPIIRPLPFPRPPHGHGHGRHRHHFFVGGSITPGCAVEWRRRFDRETGQFYRVRVVLCPPAYY